MTLFTKKILAWYHSRTRPMPWRGQEDPYKIWLSEVMLQQTQVETVIPYFNRWLKKFPTIRDVARASEDEILKAWEGLGYYARARNFHRACRQVSDLYEGRVPEGPEAFASLKGVGPYTLAAVQSIAFGQPLPAIDGNVKRVVGRLRRIRKPFSKSTSEVETFLVKHICRKNPGDFNQAMMDLGATVCRSQQPVCERCPVSAMCEAFQKGEVAYFPVKDKKPERPHYQIAVGVVWKGDKFLISKRKTGGLLGGLWEFPGGKIEKGETAMDCAVREVKEEVGIRVQGRASVGSIHHAYTHFSIEMEGIHCRYLAGQPTPIACEAVRWISKKEIPRFAFPKASHKLFPLIF